MTQEDHNNRFDDGLLSSEETTDEDLVLRKDRASVKEMIMRFERTAVSKFGGSSESLEKSKDCMLGSLTSVVNPLHLCPVTNSQDRHSNVSVNSILSNVSEISYESSSSGFASDRKSSSLRPHRPAPPPPEPFNDSSSIDSKSPVPQETMETDTRYAFATPPSSPVVLRRSRQPPVMRRKSTIGGQGHTGETHWSYGVKQRDLEKLLRLKTSEVSDNEDETKAASAPSSTDDNSSDDSNESDKVASGEEYIINNEGGRTDTMSTDHSTDTLINEYESDEGDNLSDVSGASADRGNFDNVSIKSISSFDMVPYQKYDSITVSSDEFGSEVCHAPDTEFLTVSAVNEWCVSKSAEPVLPVESKKEKYRR